jgi:hypothetical protein
MIRAQARAEALGARAAEAVAARLAARIDAEPGMAAETIEGGVAVRGRGLRHRLLWFGGMVR